MLRDEARALAEAAKGYGVDVSYVEWPGQVRVSHARAHTPAVQPTHVASYVSMRHQVHVFQAFGGLSAAAKEAVAAAALFMHQMVARREEITIRSKC